MHDRLTPFYRDYASAVTTFSSHARCFKLHRSRAFVCHPIPDTSCYTQTGTTEKN